MKALFLFLLSFSLFAHSDAWSLKDLLNNQDIPQKSIMVGDSIFSGLSGTYCIRGDLKKARNELKISGNATTKVLSVRSAKNGLIVKLRGPICTEYEAGQEGDCIKYEETTRKTLLKACDPNQKFYTRFTSPVVEFNQMVERRYTYDGNLDMTNVYFSGTLQVQLQPTAGSIEVSLKSWRYGTSKFLEQKLDTILLALDPNQHLGAKGSEVELRVSYSDFGDPTRCILRKNETSYTLICNHKTSSLGTIELPLWVLEQISTKTDFSAVNTAIPQYAIRSASTGEVLTAGKDYHSISELWKLLYHGGKEQACIEQTVENMYSLADKLLNCNGSCAGDILYQNDAIEAVHVDQEGLRIFRTNDLCTKEEGNDYSGYTCLEKRTEKSNVLIPFCS